MKENFVNTFYNLPDVVLKQKGLYLPFYDEFDTDTKAFNGLRKQYRAIGLWMRFYLCNKMEVLPELRFTDKADYKPLAERSLAYYHLAQEVFLLSDDVKNLFESPIKLWFHIEVERCGELIDKLYEGKKPMSKRTRYEKTRKLMELDPALLTPKEVQVFESPSDILINEALILASDRDNYQFRAKYRNFCRIIKRCQVGIMNSPLKPHYLKGGVLKTLRTE